MANASHIFNTIYVGLFAIFVVVNESHSLNSNESVLNVAVIGAGISGLASAKYSLAQGYNVTIFEQSEGIGGIWRYTDQVGKDQYGIDIHSAMYQGLRTNSPYQMMAYSDFPFPPDTISYPPHEQVLKYIQSYADHFNVTEHIKLNHYVVRVNPIENGQWEVIVKDLPNDTYETLIYDVVFVANGHHVLPRYPDIPGIEDFQGKVMHSHDYRRPDEFKGENVLVIGAGASGTDIVAHLAKCSNRTTSSQRKRDNETQEEREIRQKMLPANTLLQDNVKRFTETGAEFIDGTSQTFSVIIFATGYHYSFPFLSVDTGVTVDDYCILPLYQQVFNIEHPTMMFIGSIPHSIIPVYELQVRYAMKFISGEKELPSKTEMLEEMPAQNEMYCKVRGKKARKGEDDFTIYSQQLADEAGIENIPKITFEIRLDNIKARTTAVSQFRNYKYTIIDENKFIKEKYTN